jgi:two-component system, chemotaxis family, CheB/CheR fusion protein
LQSTNEELETTNEELQSTNEELETTNEELQSTNEELETTNEELQSTNEALESTNDKLRNLSEKVFQTNIFLQSILDSIRSAVIVIDETQRVMIWNARAQDLWGLQTEEVVGLRLDQLDIGLPIAQIFLKQSGMLMAGEKNPRLAVPAVNRRGRKIECSVRVTSLDEYDGARGSVIFIDETQDNRL